MTRQHVHRRPAPSAGFARLTALAVAALLGGGASAETSPYYIGVSETYGHESNVLRLLDNQVAPSGLSKADTVSTTGLVAGFDQPFGRQRAYASATVRANRYADNPSFNNTGYSANAGLDWSTIERLSGTVAATANRSLQNINTGEIVFQRQKNLESIETLNASARLGGVTQYTLELLGGHRQASNSLQDQAVQARDFSQDNVGLNARWAPSAASSFGVGVGTTRGRYPKFRLDASNGQFQPDRFKRNDISFLLSWRPSGASSIDANLNSGKTHYDLNGQRDFSGLTGAVNWLWQATGKVRLNTSYNRDTGQDSYASSIGTLAATSDYSRVVDTLRSTATYEYSAKVSFTVAGVYYKRALVRTIENPLIPLNAKGNEQTSVLALGARWVPYRFLQVGCDLNNERRNGSGELGTSLKSTSASCFGQLTLQ